ncbi:MAG TPA: hypothetical protein VHX11_08780 [Acidobacteriaceae bacterium]|jgi:hypothetical protein|nr:hypothetical protein [Acidobacteriaceae bacterium]
MATSAQPRPQEVKRREMQEVKAPEMFKFSKPGQMIAGVLRRIEPTTVNEKEAVEYMLQGENNTRLTFLGTNDLNKKIHPGHIGHYLEIRYENDDSSFQKQGQSPAKVFKVLVSKEKEVEL